MSFQRALILSVVLFGAAVPAIGQSRNGGGSPNRMAYSLAGSVRDDASQQPLENVRIDLKAQAGSTINSSFTRSNGEFEFTNLGNGEYVVEVILNGYAPFRESVNMLDGSRRGYTVFLQRDATITTTGGSSTVSAHELRVPQKARDEYQKGLALLYGKSDARGAIGQFQHAIKDFPDYYEAYAQEGSAYFVAADAPSAEAALKKSIEMSDGHYADAFFIYAGSLNNLERFSDAVDQARKGVALDDASWQGHFELARALSALKQPAEAEQNAVIARNLKPDTAQIYLILANIHIQQQNYIALVEDLDGYLKLVPTGAQADQARETRDKLKAAIEKAQSQQAGPDAPPVSQAQ
jgi:hypothetical protein